MNSLTLSSSTRSITLEETAMPETQLDLGFPLDEARLKTFLTQVVAIENEHDRLREDLRILKEDFAADLPVRAVLAAVRIARTRDKLEHHVKEPMSRVQLAVLTAMVEQHMQRPDPTVEQLLANSTHDTVNLTTGEVTA